MPFVNYLKKPKLKHSTLVAGLPGIANIGKFALDYLIRKLEAEHFAELYSEHLPEWAIREEGAVKALKVDFYHARPSGSPHDLVLATSDAQPMAPLGQYGLSGEVLDLAVEHGAERVVTMAAYILSPRETRPSVVGVGVDAEAVELLRSHGIEVLGDGMIVGMNGLLLGMAGARGLGGFGLLGVTAGGFLDPDATRVVLRTLAELLRFELDLSDLPKHVPKLPPFKPPKFELPEAVEEEVTYIR